MYNVMYVLYTYMLNAYQTTFAWKYSQGVCIRRKQRQASKKEQPELKSDSSNTITTMLYDFPSGNDSLHTHPIMQTRAYL